MPTFRFEGHDRFAKPIKGHIEASDESDACSQLRAKNIYAMKVEPDSPEAMKTVLRHDVEQADIGVVRKATSSILNQNTQRTGTPDSLEVELFGSAPTVPEKTIQQKELKPIDSQYLSNWENNLKLRLEGLSLVIKRMNEWKKDPENGPVVGGKTWEVYDENLSEIAKTILIGAMQKAVEESLVPQVPGSQYPASTTTGSPPIVKWYPDLPPGIVEQ